MERRIRIKACFEGTYAAKGSLFVAFTDFLMLEMAIVLYVDYAISTDTLNMSPAMEWNGTDGKHILSWARMNNSSNWWHSNASNSFENSQLDLSKSLVFFFPSCKSWIDTFLWMVVFFPTDCKMWKCVKAWRRKKETLEKEKSPPTCLPFALVPLSLRSPHCDDLWFTFVNKLLLCVTFCLYSSLA